MTDDRKARLAFELIHLQLNKRARSACEHLGLHTVGDALACGEDEFTRAPNCGRKTYELVRHRVLGFVEHAPAIELDGLALDRDLADVVRSPVVAILAKAGFSTVGHIVTTPRAELLAIRGVDAIALDRVHAAITAPGSRESALLPPELLEVPVDGLLLPDSAAVLARELALATVGQLLTAERDDPTLFDRRAAESVRRELARIIRRGTDSHKAMALRGSLFRPTLDCFLAELDDGEQRVLGLRVGSDQPAKEPWQIAAEQRRSEAEIEATESRLRGRLAASCSVLLDRFAATVRTELAATDGILTPERTQRGGMLDAGASAGRREAPLRLAALLFPDEFHFHGTFLSACPPARLARVVQALRELCARDVLPRRLDEVRAALDARNLGTAHEIVVHVLRTALQRSIEIDSERGEWVHVRVTTVADRLHALLDEHDAPVSLDTLMFDYRGRYRRCSRNGLLDQLRADFRFLELGPDLWSLRSRHIDELDLALPEANRVANVICTVGGRHDLADLADGHAYTERQVYLLVDALRHDPTVRDLGRHEFCPRHQENSQVMLRVIEDLGRAMGEIPISRFLANQDEHDRGLVRELLSKNRLFVCPTPDRVDMLTNYPFDADRLRRLLIVTDQCLEQHGGYSTLYQISKAVTAAELGGAFLSEHLLADLLRRHGRYEFLPGDLVAQASLGLTGWIQHQAREALRASASPLTADQLLAEHPRLAEFGHCLHELLHRDPLLATHDGEAFQLI